MLVAAFFSIAAMLAQTSANANTIAGANLLYHNTGWANTGLQITALKSVQLQSIVFQNYGANDTIFLTDNAGNTLETYDFVGDATQSASTVMLNWDLAANTTYRLLSANADNSKYNGAAFPVANSDLRVDGGFGQGTLQRSYWFHFNDLTTTSSDVPEPGSMLMVGLGLASLMAVRRRRFIKIN